MKWMEDRTLDFDTHNFSPKWYSKNWTLYKADGGVIFGREVGMAVLKEIYNPLTAHFREPHLIVCIEVADGWDMIVQAKVFGNLKESPAAGETKVKDRQGREWDMCISGGFHFHYVKDPEAENGGGIAPKKTEIKSNSGVPMGIMLKRGLIKAQDLGLRWRRDGEADVLLYRVEVDRGRIL
jgi:hypothetical protein